MSARKRAHRAVKAEPVDFKPKPEPGQDAIDLTGYETPPTASPSKKARKSPRYPRDDDSDYEPADDAAEAAATPSRTGRSPRTPATPKAQLPPATDPSTWRKSMLGPNKTIIKTKAEKLYRLKGDDFMGLHYNRIKTRDNWDCYVYNERAVERKAWEIHGSPERFDAYLAKLEQSYAKRSPGKAFPRPKIPAKVAKEQAWRTQAQTFLDVHGSDWVYKACTAYLPPVSPSMAAGGAMTVHDKTRCKALDVALRDLRLYPRRVTREQLADPDSKELLTLTLLLDQAPVSAPGMHFTALVRGNPAYLSVEQGADGRVEHGWSVPYMVAVANAIGGVSGRHGAASVEALFARWMAYDAEVFSVPPGIRPSFQGNTCKVVLQWTDKAARWFRI